MKHTLIQEDYLQMNQPIKKPFKCEKQKQPISVVSCIHFLEGKNIFETVDPQEFHQTRPQNRGVTDMEVQQPCNKCKHDKTFTQLMI